MRSIVVGAGVGALLGALGAWLSVLSPERYVEHELLWLATRALQRWTLVGLGIGALAGLVGSAPLARRRSEEAGRAAWRWVLAVLLIAAVFTGSTGGLLGWPRIDVWVGTVGVPMPGWSLLFAVSLLVACSVLVFARKTSVPVLPWGVLVGLVLLGGLAAQLGAPRAAGPNLILISIDTLRADRLGCYGYGAAQTPNIDAMAEAGTLYETVIAAAPVTLPAMSTLMTGSDPADHGVHYNGFYVLGREALTLAEILADRGYATGAVVGNFALDRRFGIDQGFESFDDRMTQRMNPGTQPHGFPEKSKSWWQEYRRTQPAQRFADEITKEGIAWLEGREGGPFALWLHYMDPHGPFLPPAPFQDGDPYDGEVAFVDAQIGVFMSAYRTRFPAADTLFVLISDHGESLGEHGIRGHVFSVYEQTLRVPFLMQRSGKVAAGRRMRAPLRGRDVRGEILRALDFDSADSVMPAAPGHAGGEDDAWWAYSETYHSVISESGGVLRSLRGVRWKLINQEGGNSVLFDLQNDPHENENVAAEYPERIRDLLPVLEHAAGQTQRASREVDEDSLDRLRDLGYVE